MYIIYFAQSQFNFMHRDCCSKHLINKINTSASQKKEKKKFHTDKFDNYPVLKKKGGGK